MEHMRLFMPTSGEDLRLLRNNRNNRPLHMALQHEDTVLIDIIKLLCYNDMSDPNNDGMTPLHQAVKQRASLVTLQLLCVRTVSETPDVDLRTVADHAGIIPLLTAVWLSLGLKRISFFINLDRMMLFKTDQDGHTPFHLAVICGASANVVALLFPGEGIQPDLRIQTNNDSNTPLMSAILHGASHTVVKQCINPEHQHALFLESTTPHPTTPLQQYLQHGTRPLLVPIVRALADRNAKLLSLPTSTDIYPCALC